MVVIPVPVVVVSLLLLLGGRVVSSHLLLLLILVVVPVRGVQLMVPRVPCGRGRRGLRVLSPSQPHVGHVVVLCGHGRRVGGRLVVTGHAGHDCGGFASLIV